jgi:hypothetical protein
VLAIEVFRTLAGAAAGVPRQHMVAKLQSEGVSG